MYWCLPVSTVQPALPGPLARWGKMTLGWWCSVHLTLLGSGPTSITARSALIGVSVPRTAATQRRRQGLERCRLLHSAFLCWRRSSSGHVSGGLVWSPLTTYCLAASFWNTIHSGPRRDDGVAEPRLRVAGTRLEATTGMRQRAQAGKASLHWGALSNTLYCVAVSISLYHHLPCPSLSPPPSVLEKA